MTGFDFSMTDSTSTDTETTTETEEVSPDFRSNETGDLYLSAGDWKATTGSVLPAVPLPDNHDFNTDDDGNLKPLKVVSDDTLEDVMPLLQKYDSAHPMQRLHLVATLLKSTAGKLQRDNSHPIGLNDGKAPESHDEVQSDVSYALFSNDLPTITWESLDGGERERLEELGLDPSMLGFDTTFGGPKILSINGERLPIVVEEGTEVEDALEILQQLPNEPSGYTEDGFRDSSDPSVFGDTDADTEKGGSGPDEVFNLAANPERVTEVNVSDLRGQGPDEFNVSKITSLRTIQTMLRVESDSEKSRKGAMERLKQRRNALQNGDDGDDAEAEDESSNDEGSEAVEGVDQDALDQVQATYGFTDFQMNAVQHRVKAGKNDSVEEAAMAVSEA